jgi:two-component system OmpR family response regulator
LQIVEQIVCQINSTQQVDKMSQKTKVLVVDDEEIVRRSYARTLTGDNCNVEVAWNGKDALQAMEQRPVDVVLLDLRMPGMDGMAVLKAIKAQWPEIEVVVITGNPSIESAKEAVALGAYDYLAKPVGPDDVIQATNRAMTHKKWALRCEAQNQSTAIH